MFAHRSLRKVFTQFIVPAFLLTSCSAFWETQGLLNPKMESLDNELKELRVGDTVKLSTNDGREEKFKIVEIKADTLLGDHQKIAFGQIVKVKKVHSAGAKAGSFLGNMAIVSVGLSLAALILLSSL